MADEQDKACRDGGMAEQRHLLRRQLIYYLRVHDGTSSRVAGHVVDISPHGLKLITDHPVAVGERCRLRMSFPGRVLKTGIL